MKQLRLIAGAFFALALFSAPAAADPITFTFSETLPVASPAPVTTPTTNLSVSGVTFNFQVNNQPSPDARFGANGPANNAFTQGQVLEGDAAGILRLTFSTPSTVLNYGAIFSATAAVPAAYTVTLIDAATQATTLITRDARLEGGVVGDLFTYAGAPISGAIVNFNETALGGARRFAIDNVTIDPIPEPATMVLLGTGLAGVATSVRRKRRKARSASAEA